MIIKKELQPWQLGAPGFLILLVYGDKKSCDLANSIINEAIQINFGIEKPRDRCYIMVFDLSNEGKFISGWLSEFDENPVTIDTVRKVVSDGVGGWVEVDIHQPVWVNPSCQKKNVLNDETLLLTSIDALIDEWLKEKEDIESAYVSRCCCPILIDVNHNLDRICDSVSENVLYRIKEKAFIFDVSTDEDINTHINTNYYDIISLPRNHFENICDKNDIAIKDHHRISFAFEHIRSLIFELCTHNVGYHY